MTSAPAALRDDELLIERTFDAPLALVWRLWESSDHMIRWWGPEKFTTTAIDWALTSGKAWSATMVSTQHGVSRMSGIVQEVTRHKHIIFSFAWDNDSGRGMETVITVTFAERDGKTTQSFHQTPFASVQSRDSHVGGWTSLINKQQVYFENLAIAESKGLRV